MNEKVKAIEEKKQILSPAVFFLASWVCGRESRWCLIVFERWVGWVHRYFVEVLLTPAASSQPILVGFVHRGRKLLISVSDRSYGCRTPNLFQLSTVLSRRYHPCFEYEVGMRRMRD